MSSGAARWSSPTGPARRSPAPAAGSGVTRSPAPPPRPDPRGNPPTLSPRGPSGSGVGQVGRISDVDLGDCSREVTLVVGDEPVGAHADGGGQVGRVGGL